MHETDYGLTEDHGMIRDTVRKLATDEIEPGSIERDASREMEPAILEQMAEMALFGIHVPDDLGGAGFDHLAYAVAVEEIARADGSPALVLLGHVSLGIAPILECGTDTQKSEWLPRLAGAEAFASFALPSLAGLDSSDTPICAKKDGDAFVLEGGPLLAIGATRASVFLVPAWTGAERGPDALTVFLVPADASGVTVGDRRELLGCRAADIREVSLAGVRVGAEAALGGEGGGRAVHDATNVHASVALAALATGVAQAALDKACPYAKEREAFDRPLATFDAIADRITSAATDTHLARLAVYHAARRLDAGPTAAAIDAAMAKLFAAGAASRATDHAVQVLGGYGYSREYHVERYYRDARLAVVGGSPSEDLHARVASVLTSV